MTNISSGQVVDNRSQFQAQNNYVGFFGSGTGFWTIQFEYADASSTGPWTAPGGTATITNFTSPAVGWYLGFHNFYRWTITGSAVVRYSSVKDFWMPDAGNGNQIATVFPPYITNATTSPQFIPLTTHQQGQNAAVVCYSGPVVNLAATGHEVYCDSQKNATGDVTVTWAGSTVQSIMVFSPANSVSHLYSGPTPYVINAQTSPQVIPAFTHGQGQNVVVQCFSGLLTPDFHVTGLWTPCENQNDGQGNITVTWFDGVVGSIMVSGAGPGPQGPSGLGAMPYVTAATTSPQTIPQNVHRQGYNPITACFSGPPLNGPGANQRATGTQYPCTVVLDPAGSGNVTVSWPGSAVGSIVIQTSGRPAPYVANATGSPMSIPQSAHSQGANANAKCYDGPVTVGITTGNEVVCGVRRDSAGNLTVLYGGNSVLSISVQ